MRTCTTCGQRFSGDAVFCPFDGTKLEGGTTSQPPAPSRDEIAPGTVVGGNYRVEKILGEGGMGVVYAVTHLRLNKKFALKLLKRDLAKDPETRARFLLEAQAAGQIRHPNVVEITDYASQPDGSAYLVMEYLDGQPLSRMIKLGGAIPALRAVSIIRDVASALQAAHDNGVVHRDLKPDNVFVIQQGSGDHKKEVAKILDFGVAKVAGSAKLTRTGMVFGTPHYMSPEQASGGVVDARTDVYALGVIMYEMFTGRVPFEADTYMGVLTKHMFEAPLPPSQVAGPAKELGALEDVTLKALAKRPEDRYASMNALITDLDRILQVGPDGRAVIAQRIDGLSRPDFRKGAEEARKSFAGIADELEPPARAELSAAWANDRERRVRRIGVAAVAAIVGVGVGISVLALAARKTHDPDAKSSAANVAPGEATTMAKAPASVSATATATAAAPSSSTPAPIATAQLAPATTANSTAATAAPAGENQADTPGTSAATQHPTSTAKPTKPNKKLGSGEAEDPWAK